MISASLSCDAAALARWADDARRNATEDSINSKDSAPAVPAGPSQRGSFGAVSICRRSVPPPRSPMSSSASADPPGRRPPRDPVSGSTPDPDPKVPSPLRPLRGDTRGRTTGESDKL